MLVPMRGVFQSCCDHSGILYRHLILAMWMGTLTYLLIFYRVVAPMLVND